MRLSVSLGALASGQLLASFVYQLVVLGAVGAGAQTDAWVAAQALPGVLYAILSTAMQGAWQSRLAAAGGDHRAWLRTHCIAQGQFWLVAAPVLALLLASASLWTTWLFPGFSLAQASLTATMSHPLLVGAVLNAQVALMTSAMRGRDRFIGCELVALAGALVAIVAALALVPGRGVETAAWISLARAIAVLAGLFWLVERPWPRFREAAVDREGWRQCGPLLVGGMVYKSGPLIDRVFASMAPVGGMTIFNLAQMCFNAVGTVLERAISTPQVPKLARLAADRRWPDVISVLRRCLLKGLWIPAVALGVLLIVQPWWPAIVRPLLRIDDDALRDSWLICAALCTFLYPAAVGSVVVSTFFALGDTRTVARIGIAGFVVSIAVKYAGFSLAGLVGLAAGVTCHYVLNMAVLVLLLRRRLWHLRASSA